MNTDTSLTFLNGRVGEGMDSYSMDSKVRPKKSCQGGQWVGPYTI